MDDLKILFISWKIPWKILYKYRWMRTMRKSGVPRDLTPIFRSGFHWMAQNLESPKSGELVSGYDDPLHISAESERVFYINRNDDEMGVNSSAIQIVFD